MPHLLAAITFTSGLAWCALADGPAKATAWKDRVDALVAPAIAKKQFVGLVVGISTAEGKRYYFGYGKTKADGSEPDAETIFQLGSITKPLTALLLALLVEAGAVKLDDPVKNYLPKDFVVPRRGERDITLVELATHTSGLPNIPANLVVVRGSERAKNPYGEYDAAQLRIGVRGTNLEEVAKPKAAYSNFGFGLLGEALSHQGGASYETLFRTRIAAPLGMTSSFVEPTPELRKRMATGHDRNLEPACDWTFQALVGAGGIRSTAADMLNLLVVRQS